MPTTPPPLVFNHATGFEIDTKHKEAIRQLHGFGEKLTAELMGRYKLSKSTIHHVLAYDVPERARPKLSRTSRPQQLTDAKVNEVIEYCAKNWEQRIMDYQALIDELKLDCKASTLQKRLHQRGYFRCVACQKPYHTAAQVLGRLL